MRHFGGDGGSMSLCRMCMCCFPLNGETHTAVIAFTYSRMGAASKGHKTTTTLLFFYRGGTTWKRNNNNNNNKGSCVFVSPKCYNKGNYVYTVLSWACFFFILFFISV